MEGSSNNITIETKAPNNCLHYSLIIIITTLTIITKRYRYMGTITGMFSAFLGLIAIPREWRKVLSVVRIRITVN